MRLASQTASGDAKPATLVPEGPLATILEALDAVGAERTAVAEVLRQRLGDARTIALLAQGDAARGAGTLVHGAALRAGDAVRRLLAERPDDAAGRLACVRAKIRFGEVLLAQGLAAPRRLAAALEAQKSSGRRVGEELIAEGLISAREVAEALWLQHKLAATALALLLLPPREAAAPRLVHSTK